MGKQEIRSITKSLFQPMNAEVVGGDHNGRVGTILRENATHYGVVLGPEATWALIPKSQVLAS